MLKIHANLWKMEVGGNISILHGWKVWWGIIFGSLMAKLKSANISYSHILYMYVWQSLTKLPNLDPPMLLQSQFWTQPLNLIPAKFSGYAVLQRMYVHHMHLSFYQRLSLVNTK